MDITLPVTGGALAVVAGGFMGKQVWRGIMNWKASVDDHLVNCAKKEGDEKLLSYRVEQLEKSVNQNHRQVMDRLTEMAGPARYKAEIPHEGHSQ